MAGIYAHIPFCHAKCAYCDFYSTPLKDGFNATATRFVDVLLDEFALRSDELHGEPVTTLYIGGGTPSSLPPDQLERLIGGLYCDTVTELTVEVNPEDVELALCRAMRRAGVNRVSMGVQSLVDAELKAVGRRHSAAQALDAFSMLRDEGFNNISLDLIYGLPGQTPDSFIQSLSHILSLKPEHLSCYLLSYEEGTRLWAMREAGKIAEASEAVATDCYRHLCRLAAEAGMEHYEISNFAMPGFRARHNANYWRGIPYLGLGPGAHSFDGSRRRYNGNNLNRWLESPAQVLVCEPVNTPGEAVDEYLMTRLRTDRGIDLDEFGMLFGADSLSRLRQDMAPLLRRQMLICHEGQVRVPENRWLLTDAVLIELLQG